jgi:orotidine 5'-phosphate decarboxylase subfamily 1
MIIIYINLYSHIKILGEDVLENLRMTYEERAKKALNPAAKKIFSLMAEKKTNLALANDETDPKKFLELSEKIGPEIAVLKTHIDVLREFSPAITKKLVELSKKHNFMIFEDRKFADIGNTVKLQYSEGLYKIVDWANFVNLHIVPGPGIIDALNGVMKERKDDLPRGILILAQMSSEGTLAFGEYTKKAVELANSNKNAVAGYIGNGGDTNQLRELASMCFVGHVIFTPGVQIQSKADNLGQRYTAPEEAVLAGSDCIIVGRGIYGAENPLEMAKKYREAGWNAYLKRVEG